jgi:hypothetical protein
MEKISDELINFFIKFVFIPLIAVCVKLSVTSMSGAKITKLNIALSLFVGVAIPFILKDLISAYVPENWTTAVIGLTAILSDKIAETIIKKVKIDLIITSLINNLLTQKSKD